MRCYNCGKNIEDGSFFCEFCGARQDQGMPQQGVPQQGMPQQGMPQQGVPQQGMPQQGMPQQGVLQQGMPQQGMPQQGMPQQGYNYQAYPQYPAKTSSPWFAIVSVAAALVLVTLIILFLAPGILTKKHRQTLIEEAASQRMSQTEAKNTGSGTLEPFETTGLIIDTTEDTEEEETTEKKKKTTEDTEEEKTTEKKKKTTEDTEEAETTEKKKKTTEEKTTEKQKKTTEAKTTEKKKTTEKTTEQKKDPVQEAYDEAAKYFATAEPDYADFDWYTVDYWNSDLPYDRIDNKDKLIGPWKCMIIWDPERTSTGTQAWEFMNVNLSFDDAAGQAIFVLDFCFTDYEYSEHVDERNFDNYYLYGNIMPHGLFVNEPFYLEVTGFYTDGTKQYMTGHAVGQSGEPGAVAFVRP